MKARQCPWCRGEGGFIDIIVDGQGPREECGICLGTGELRSKKLYYQALGWLSNIARLKKRKPDEPAKNVETDSATFMGMDKATELVKKKIKSLLDKEEK